MSSSCFLLALYLFTVMAMSMFPPSPSRASASAIGEHHHQLRWVHMTTTTPPPCQGSIEECIAAGGEFRMESSEPESHRRILATSQYISYRALQRNTVPCSRKGASYYNCKGGAEANPYNRGCPTITRCRTTS